MHNTSGKHPTFGTKEIGIQFQLSSYCQQKLLSGLWGFGVPLEFLSRMTLKQPLAAFIHSFLVSPCAWLQSDLRNWQGTQWGKKCSSSFCDECRGSWGSLPLQ